MATPVDIGALRFASKKAAKEYFRQMRDQYPVGQRIPDPDHTRLLWLLTRSPWADEKIGCGIDHFSVAPSPPPFTTIGFWITRTDGSMTDISFPHCVDGKDASPLQEVRKALRAVIEPDVFAYTLNYFKNGPALCQITGKLITSYQADAHHAPPTFAALVDEFLSDREIEPSMDLLVYEDKQLAPRLKDRALAEDWRMHHFARAVVLIVDKREHRSLAGGK